MQIENREKGRVREKRRKIKGERVETSRGRSSKSVLLYVLYLARLLPGIQVVLDMDFLDLNATLPALNSSVSDCSEMLEGFWVCFSIVVVLLGFPISIWVLWDLVDKHCRGGQPWTPNTVFTLNVTVMDLVFLAYLPVNVVNIIFLKNKILMKISFVTISLNLTGRPLLMACMCLDCYVAVHQPLRYRSQTLSSRVIITAVIWLVSLVNGAAFSMNEELVGATGMWWPFLSSAAVIVYCDCCLLWTLSRSRTSRGEPHQLKKRALDIISTSLLVTVANYLPMMIMIPFGRYLVFQIENNYFCLINSLALILLESTSVFMPALYLMKVGKLNFATIFKPLSQAVELVTTRV
ncbi:platelet-activating factor receptor-like [Gadus macrocephalus]|uniref:platelet-activating factor receptor-like n=1 Tax=Gadus macrocephalus TaxID=80720 RepID=UPI0028CB775D|nr:platelet-activating factor receptor-like [Gadus macrocephalus]